jgi:hypothetical protein
MSGRTYPLSGWCILEYWYMLAMELPAMVDRERAVAWAVVKPCRRR